MRKRNERHREEERGIKGERLTDRETVRNQAAETETEAREMHTDGCGVMQKMLNHIEFEREGGKEKDRA